MKKGPNSTASATVFGHLKAFKASDSRIEYIYMLEQLDGTVRFIVDANYGLPDGSKYMQEYPNAPAELKAPVTAPIAIGPHTDSRGTFYSGYEPINTGLNESVVLVGVDIRV